MKDKEIPSIKVNILSNIKPEVQDIEEKIDNLIKYTGNNSKEINNLSVDSPEEILNKTEKHFNNNSQSLGFLEEMVSDVGLNNLDAEYTKKYELIQRTYRNIQNNYFTKKIEILNEKTKKYTKEKNEEIRQSVEKATSETNKITENLLLSVISIFLGVSLVTAMITGIEKMGITNMFAYFTSICWITIIVLGFAYILVRQEDSKTKYIITTMILTTIILAFVLYKSYL